MVQNDRSLRLPILPIQSARQVLAGIACLLLVACSAPTPTTPLDTPARSLSATQAPEIVDLPNSPTPSPTRVRPTQASEESSAVPARIGVEATTPAPDIPVSPPATPPPEPDEANAPQEDATLAGPAPDFKLESAQGAEVTLSDYAGVSNVVLVFYRGQT